MEQQQSTEHQLGKANLGRPTWEGQLGKGRFVGNNTRYERVAAALEDRDYIHGSLDGGLIELVGQRD